MERTINFKFKPCCIFSAGIVALEDDMAASWIWWLVLFAITMTWTGHLGQKKEDFTLLGEWVARFGCR